MTFFINNYSSVFLILLSRYPHLMERALLYFLIKNLLKNDQKQQHTNDPRIEPPIHELNRRSVTVGSANIFVL